MEKICVAIRVRPPKTEEDSNGSYWKVDDNRISLHKPLGTPISGVSYAFDHVFDQSCTNSRVYQLLVKNIIEAVVEGFNGTAFAYGQTSSGKTFTMNGSEGDPGVVPLAVRDIFEKIQMTTDREFLIRVSYMEIYNEEINDLFAVENQKLPIHESLERGIFVAGLREEIVNSAEQVLELIKLGEGLTPAEWLSIDLLHTYCVCKCIMDFFFSVFIRTAVNRHFGETNMNARSSRSHTIFRMVIESKGKDTNSCNGYSHSDAVRVSVLNLVDLAGSERIAKTGAGGVRLKEGKYINKSLMVLGNVINKLSDGVKQRGHIPYRDSKLTRILQPALGGNAKTSIICTVAPEEVHVEESKGTLQFASRAKRITNCAQVNEILTDAALLKRQRQEIEELRKKLQGSRSEVLEQEILKLRNDMLKYELEREKLAMELEEERKSHKERDQCIREQQMKIENLSNLVTYSESDRSSQGLDSVRQNPKEESNDSQSGDAFRTPCFRAKPNSFVVKRSTYSRFPDNSPLPDNFSNVADEDTWFKLNKGFTADLDSLQITPARKFQSSRSSDITPGSRNEYYKHELQNLKRQLEVALDEKKKLQKNHDQQLLLNDQLKTEISELQKESQLFREIPKMLHESVTNCKDAYGGIVSVMQSYVPGEKSCTAKLLASICEIGSDLFSSLENHFAKATNGEIQIVEKNSQIQEQGKVLQEKLNSTVKAVATLDLSTREVEQAVNHPPICRHKDCMMGEESTCWEDLSNELAEIKEKCKSLEKEMKLNNKLLEASKQSYQSLERDYYQLKGERDSLSQKVSNSCLELALVTDEKDKVLRDLELQVQRRKNLEEEIKQFSVAFASRQKSLMTFHSEFKSKIGTLKSQNPVSTPNSPGCRALDVLAFN
ncbi:Kinesin motor domain [Dillenia turbinata]|uniref:Kinesin-like protein n=1 Tax=Dillenia turbinata TaxID=194707 RepID=A0AAN8ZHX8_9MAGN